MVLTDVAAGWTECLPLVARSGALVIEALAAAMALFPFLLRGVDFDNNGLFMNEPVVTWCRQKGLEVTTPTPQATIRKPMTPTSTRPNGLANNHTVQTCAFRSPSGCQPTSRPRMEIITAP
jgi:hypothetical protein